jgi:outer membrane protein, adhesin transport system
MCRLSPVALSTALSVASALLSGCSPNMMTTSPPSPRPGSLVAGAAPSPPPPQVRLPLLKAGSKAGFKAGSISGLQSAPADLATTVSIALSRHPDIGRANAEITRSGGDVRVAESAWYPRVGYTSSFGKSSTPTASTADGSALHAGLEINQLIYDFGRADGQLLAARALRAQRSAEFADTEERVALAATEAYLELDRAKALTDASSRYLTALVNLRTTIAIRADSGAANRADVHVAETRVQSAKAERIRSETRFVQAQARLVQLTGTDIRQVASPQRTITRLIQLIDAAPASQGTGVAAAEQAAEAARARLKIAQVANYPSIGARAAYTRPFGQDGTTPTSTIGLTINGDIFNGGASEGRAMAAAGELAASEKSAAVARLNNATDVAVARAEISGARDRTGIYGRQLESARQARETSLAEYTIGKRTLTEVLNAEQEISRAETDRINADCDANIAIARAGAARKVLIASVVDAARGR